MPMTPQEFAGKIRSKYPGAYDSLDDNTLTQKILQKYPDYSSVVSEPSAPEKQGQLESGALGLMSGIPGAEAAISGIKAISPDTTYEQAHQGLEQAKDAAWEQNPVAYGVGKTAGIVGTGAATGGLGIPGAIGVGAASGLDEAERPADMLADAAKGGAVGGVLGTIGEKVVSPLLEKLPGVAKAGLASLGKETTPETIGSYLKNPEAINSALTKDELAENFAGKIGNMGDDVTQMSAQARNLLNNQKGILSAPPAVEEAVGRVKAPTSINWGTPSEGITDPLTGEVSTPSVGGGKTVITHGVTDPIMGVMQKDPDVSADTLTPIFNQLKSPYLQNGVPKNSAAASAINALDDQYERLLEIAQNNGGQLTESDIKEQIVGLQKLTQRAFVDDATVSESKDALKNLSGALNGILKTSGLSPEEIAAGKLNAYGEAMGPVAEQTSLLNRLKDKFSLDTNDEGKLVPSDSTASRVMNAIKEGKTESYELLNDLKNVTGVDYLQKVKDSMAAHALGITGAGMGLRDAAVMGGYGIGHMTHLPFGGIIGAAGGRMLANSMDGGQIAKSIMDRYLSFKGSGMNAALQKYGPILIKAAKAGGNQLASTHFVLATSSPDYQKLIAEHQEQ